MMPFIRHMRRCGLILAALAVLSCVPSYGAGNLEVCILRGLGGEPEQEARFRDWSGRLVAALTAGDGLPPERVRVFPAVGESDVDAPLTREKVATVFDGLAAQLQPEDTLLLVLIGHGSLQREPKFMVAGPDIAADEFKAWLEALPNARQAIINTASSSAGFINVLSGPGRIICTSTRSGTERNATEFMEHFLQAMEQESGDVNHDGQTTLVELCNAATESTQRWYEKEGFIVTEHALLDDNGDGLGTRLPLVLAGGEENEPEGIVADALVLKQSAVYAAADPALVARYREAIAAVEALTATKSTLEEAQYWAQLEQRLLEAARLNRAIHEYVPPAAPLGSE